MTSSKNDLFKRTKHFRAKIYNSKKINRIKDYLRYNPNTKNLEKKIFFEFDKIEVKINH